MPPANHANAGASRFASASSNPLAQDPSPQYVADGIPAEALPLPVPLARDDGRVDVILDPSLSRTLSLLIPTDAPTETSRPCPPPAAAPSACTPFPLKLNIVIQVVGSRGDVQPFIALGTELRKRHGHRVRLATHDVFASFVRSAGLDFFPIGGDPAELMSYMVRNPGLIPSVGSLCRGDVRRKRRMLAEILSGCWRSCLEADPATGRPFVADAIIANPPSFAHLHCAQALGVPVHLVFTMPWTSTREFRHPLANVKTVKGVSRETANLVSWVAVEWLTWQGLGDIINGWRRSIDLEPVPLWEGPLLAEALRLPCTYCWSPALVGKPADWPAHVDVCGFFFREAPDYSPPPDLAGFLLRRGPPPVYIGFGSVVVAEPARMTRILADAVRRTGVRAIISRGWSNLGDGADDDPNILYLGDCPHEWLFRHVAAVVHHGGAGTTACGLLNGLPTFIVPFFGDQPFWGEMVARSGAGPQPIPWKKLTVDNLADAIRFCLGSEAADAARELSEKIGAENGVKAAVRSFHANLPLPRMRCEIIDDQFAAFVVKRGTRKVRLSKQAVGVLLQNHKIKPREMSLNNPRKIQIVNRRWDPVTGFTSSVIGMAAGMVKSTADIVVRPVRAYRRQTHGRALPPGTFMPTTTATADPGLPYSEGSLPRSPPPEPGCMHTTGMVIVASCSGLVGFLGTMAKGFLVDLPLAVAEGSRAVPRLYGEEVDPLEAVTDWKTGARVGVRNFIAEVGGAVADPFVRPVRGAKRAGVVGAAQGVATGLVGMAAKTVSAGAGFVAYPMLGVYQSLRTVARSRVRREVLALRSREAMYLASGHGGPPPDHAWVLARFAKLAHNKRWWRRTRNDGEPV